MCRNCKPPAWHEEFLPTQIVIEAGKRTWQRLRMEMRDIGHLVQEGVSYRENSGGLVLKVVKYFKTWYLSADEDGTQFLSCGQKTTVWHRDLVAAKCILYKGMCISNNNGMTFEVIFDAYCSIHFRSL